MGKSTLLNEDIKSISKLMGYDRGLTSVENNVLFEEKQINEQQSKIIPFENYDDISVSWDMDENGNPVISDYQTLSGIASGLEDAADGPVDDEDLNDVYNAVTFLTGKYTDEGQAACEKVLEIYADKTGNENLSGEIASAGSNALGGFGFGVVWSDDDDMKLGGKSMTFGNAKRQIQKAIKGCSRPGKMTSSGEKNQDELKSQWPKKYNCVAPGIFGRGLKKGKFQKTKSGGVVYIIKVDSKMASASGGNLNEKDKIVYYDNGTMRVYPRGKGSLSTSKGPFPYSCGKSKDMEFEVGTEKETEVQTESRTRMEKRYKLLIQEQMNDVNGVFIDFGDGTGDTPEDTSGDVGTETQKEVKKGTKYRKVTYTFEDIINGKVEAKLGDVNRDENGAIFKVQETIGSKPDGVFGPNTKKAVETYQQRKELDIDGSFGKEEATTVSGGSVGTESETAPGGNADPNAKDVSAQAVEVIKKEITSDSDTSETLEYLKNVRETKLDETACIQLVVAANGALPKLVEELYPKLQACFYDYNFPRGIGRRAVKKRYGITGKGRKK